MSNRIKEIRKAKGITQKELAAKMGVTPQAVSQFEKNSSDRFTISTLQSIADALECQIDDLIGKGEEFQGNEYYFESEKTDGNTFRVTALTIDLRSLNRMGIDALQDYLELLLSSEKYTSSNLSYLSAVWDDQTMQRFYPVAESADDSESI